MENLKRILNILKDRTSSFKGNYYIPQCWNTFGFSLFSKDSIRDAEINVDPYEYMIFCIESQILNRVNDGSMQKEQVFLTQSIIYSMLPRMFTAWNHDGEDLKSGTFLKAICLLPYLKKLNVGIIYLLPIFEYSDLYKKGEMGSPYSIKNIYKLDTHLHDPLLGEDRTLIDTEFKAFVEACHLLGIKVMVDFVFRTVARDSALMVEHPEWFYWIQSKYKNTFCAPVVEKEKKHTVVSEKAVESIYTCKNIKKYLSQFTDPPNAISDKRWSKIVKKHRDTGENILDLIEKEFEITTAPGFSDVLNDPQPPWSDATYLKFYFDPHKEAKRYIGEKQPPYVLQDVAKLNLFRGELCNQELWDYTVNVIPYYQKNFGIDGARIDMGHALPPALNEEIIRKTKTINPNFLLWSEEFNHSNSKKAKENGFHFMTGSLWWEYKKVEKSNFYKVVIGSLAEAVLPITGALESPDTPRAAYQYKGEKNLEFMVFLNYFAPNVVPLINNGMELLEVQPMNLGLDNTEKGRFVLPKKDPMYGKLAFFDPYQLHWNSPHFIWMLDVMLKAKELRNRFDSIMANKENFIYQPEMEKSNKLLCLSYYDKKKKKGFFFIANKGCGSNARVEPGKIIPKQILGKGKISLVYLEGEVTDIKWDLDKRIILAPKEVIIGEIS